MRVKCPSGRNCASRRNATISSSRPAGGPSPSSTAPPLTLDLVGQGKDGAEAGAKCGGEAEQCLVAGIALAALEAADLREVGFRALGQLLLAQPGLLAEAADGLAQG